MDTLLVSFLGIFCKQCIQSSPLSSFNGDAFFFFILFTGVVLFGIVAFFGDAFRLRFSAAASFLSVAAVQICCRSFRKAIFSAKVQIIVFCGFRPRFDFFFGVPERNRPTVERNEDKLLARDIKDTRSGNRRCWWVWRRHPFVSSYICVCMYWIQYLRNKYVQRFSIRILPRFSLTLIYYGFNVFQRYSVSHDFNIFFYFLFFTHSWWVAKIILNFRLHTFGWHFRWLSICIV